MLLSATEVAVKTINLDSYSIKDVWYEAEVMVDTVALEVTRHASGYHVILSYRRMSSLSVMLMSVLFSLCTVAIPVHMLIPRPCTSPSQGVWLSTLTAHTPMAQ